MPSTPIPIRFEDDLLAEIDRLRGSTPRGTWVKGLCRDAVAAHGALAGAGSIQLSEAEARRLAALPGASGDLSVAPAELEGKPPAQSGAGGEDGSRPGAPSESQVQRASAQRSKALLPGQRKPGGVAVRTSAAPRGPVAKRAKGKK